jgi:NAD(P)-dependent dehydrogenase (short-subunit alcohol dehydrogenase family)
MELYMEFQGKRIAITGAGRAFGRTLAIEFAKLGAEIFISARTEEKTRDTESLVKQQAPKAIVHCFAVDLLNPKQIGEFALDVGRVTPSIDVLIHNAALWLETDFYETDDELIVDAVNTTATGTILITKHFTNLLKQSGAGDIVFLNGSAALPNSRHGANAAFSAAKAAQATFADRIRHELRPNGIRVLTIYPPDFENTVPQNDNEWNYRRDRFADMKLTARNVFECIKFALLQDRICAVDQIVLSNNNGRDIGN